MPVVGPMELFILFGVVFLPTAAILGLVFMLTAGSKRAQGSPDDDLNHVLRDLSAGLERMEARMESVEEVLGAGKPTKN